MKEEIEREQALEKRRRALDIYEQMCEWEWEDLRQPLMDTILSFFNGDYESEPTQLLDNLSGIFEIFNFWRLHGKPAESGDNIEFTAKNLLNFFVDQVIQVINEILDKLLHKAIHRYRIISLSAQ